jgi:glycosyltransferase involved in cell wall biosynthesis
VVAAHSGAFPHPRWRHFPRLQFGLCRRAATTTVTSEHHAALVRRNGGHATVVPDVPISFGPSAESSLSGEFYAVCVTSFDRDEPIEAMFEAARLVPEVRFYMTGRPTSPERLRGLQIPPNLTLTGFLETGAFGSLVCNAGVVMALTTDDHTMQRGAWEAIYQGTPVIVSDFPILRREFAEGAVHVANTAEAIAAAVREVARHRDRYRRGAWRLKGEKESRWDTIRPALLAAVRGRADSR